MTNMLFAVLTSILSLVCAAGTALPGGLDEIKTKDFQGTVSTGMWWIKFYSPYCPHCTHMAPFWNETWHTLEDEGAVTTDNFHMASVNCVTDGDLCDRNDISGYPTLRLFKDGQKVEDFLDRDRTTAKLLEFARGAIKSNGESNAQQSETVKEVETTEAKDEAPAAGKGEGGALSKSLNYDQFLENVGKTDKPWLVKFFSPKCPYCNKLAPAWKRLAARLGSEMNIAEINCDAERQLCKDMEVKLIPDIYYFDGPAKVRYEGKGSFEEMLAFARQLEKAGTVREVKTSTQLEKARLNNEKDGVAATILYVYNDASSSEDWNALKRASLDLYGKVAFVKTAAESELGNTFASDTIPVYKGMLTQDQFITYEAYGPGEQRDVSRLKQWAKELWLYNVPQLDFQTSHDALDSTDYVVIGLLSKDLEKDKLISSLKESARHYIANRQRQDDLELGEKRRQKQAKIDSAVAADDGDAEIKAKNMKVKVGAHPKVGFVWLDLAAGHNMDWAISRFGESVLTRCQVVINSNPRGVFWADGIHGAGISASTADISEALQALLISSTKMHEQVLFLGIRSVPHMVIWYLSTHKLFTLGLVMAVLFVVNRRHRRLSPRKNILPISGKIE